MSMGPALRHLDVEQAKDDSPSGHAEAGSPRALFLFATWSAVVCIERASAGYDTLPNKRPVFVASPRMNLKGFASSIGG